MTNSQFLIAVIIFSLFITVWGLLIYKFKVADHVRKEMRDEKEASRLIKKAFKSKDKIYDKGYD